MLQIKLACTQSTGSAMPARLGWDVETHANYIETESSNLHFIYIYYSKLIQQERRYSKEKKEAKGYILTSDVSLVKRGLYALKYTKLQRV